MKEKTAGQIYKQNIGSVVIVATQAGGQRGSGIVIGENEIATNCHVVDDGSPIFIQRPGESESPFPRKFYARIVASSVRDICLLKTEGLSAPAVQIGESKSLDVGDTVYAIGNPNPTALWRRFTRTTSRRQPLWPAAHLAAACSITRGG